MIALPNMPSSDLGTTQRVVPSGVVQATATLPSWEFASPILDGRPANAIEMLDTRIDRELRVFGHDFQDRWRTDIRTSEHRRNLFEGHRAGANLRVVKYVGRRV